MPCERHAALTSLEGLPRFDLTGNSIPAHGPSNDPAEPPIMPYDGLISTQNSARGLDEPAGALNQLRMGPAGGEHAVGGRDSPGAPAAGDDGGVRDMLTPATSKAGSLGRRVSRLEMWQSQRGVAAPSTLTPAAPGTVNLADAVCNDKPVRKPYHRSWALLRMDSIILVLSDGTLAIAQAAQQGANAT